MTTQQLLIAGGGIGGLAAALAVARAGWEVRLYERAAEFSEVGAGVQLGPNVTRILQAWGLEDELRAVAAFPDRLQVRNATSGADLGTLALGARALERYGAPYATVHRSDLHRVLCMAAGSEPNVHLNLDHWLTSYVDDGKAVTLGTVAGQQIEGDALLGADGLWSRVRQQLLNDGPPRVTGHLAYRTMLRQSALPAALRSAQVTAWLGPRLHVVQYPVRRGEWMNVVAIVHGDPPADAQGWDHGANAADLQRAMGDTCAPLRELIAAVPEATVNDHAWRLWALADRPPVQGAGDMAQGLVALAGDAAHPMRPYLAQGAGMAIEDAAELARALAMDAVDVPTRLKRYALARWQRCARVQARSIRNGQIFHSTGVVRLGRDASIKLLGERILDVPWLYAG
ncbi:FAD-dependent monooxygenase [Ottowia testudinis]|uniref:FAD-dependent monooxygenase n=1 Tax=Ottowia testudinis TaxID=2816950 RepID=A0A975CDV5_9BURK|nr:FAD-dependent monooxygenase [Ottowia testudinis]QTD43956.1 FAD-dependent monooxygenase [Ottowia testudinis]